MLHNTNSGPRPQQASDFGWNEAMQLVKYD